MWRYGSLVMATMALISNVSLAYNVCSGKPVLNGSQDFDGAKSALTDERTLDYTHETASSADASGDSYRLKSDTFGFFDPWFTIDLEN